MRIIVILLLAISLVGCVEPQKQIPKKERNVYVDPAILPYVEEYEEKYNASIIDISMDFDIIEQSKKQKNKKTRTVGVCRYTRNDRSEPRSIWIHEPAWKNYNRIKRRWLIYHEIAHCYENLAHREFLLVDDCPGSILDPLIPSERCIKKHWKYYEDELLYQYNKILWEELFMDETGGRIGH